MLEKLKLIDDKYRELNLKMTDPEVFNDPDTYQKLAMEQAEIRPVAEKYREYMDLKEQIEGAEQIIAEEKDKEMLAMAEEEKAGLEETLAKCEEEIKVLLLPKDPNDGRNAILEIRAGAGGDEAGLFAADLLRLYQRYAQSHRWKFEILNSSESGIGGIKDAYVLVSGKDVFSRLKYESGTHRVQRVPKTESQGRIHTSTATIAVLPEAEEVDIEIKNEDLRIDTYRSSGNGGQSVNTTDSAVRVTHIPTGLVVSCQDGKSQLDNKTKALQILKARLYDMEQQKIEQERAAQRKSQVGTGDRSAKIRTYNFPQSRITDHRVPYTAHNLEAYMDGDIDEMIDIVSEHFRAIALSNADY